MPPQKASQVCCLRTDSQGHTAGRCLRSYPAANRTMRRGWMCQPPQNCREKSWELGSSGGLEATLRLNSSPEGHAESSTPVRLAVTVRGRRIQMNVRNGKGHGAGAEGAPGASSPSHSRAGLTSPSTCKQHHTWSTSNRGGAPEPSCLKLLSGVGYIDMAGCPH